MIYRSRVGQLRAIPFEFLRRRAEGKPKIKLFGEVSATKIKYVGRGRRNNSMLATLSTSAPPLRISNGIALNYFTIFFRTCDIKKTTGGLKSSITLSLIKTEQISNFCASCPLKGMCGGPRCTILMHVNAYDSWCCVRVIPLNLYIFQEDWSFQSLSKRNGGAMPFGGSGEKNKNIWGDNRGSKYYVMDPPHIPWNLYIDLHSLVDDYQKAC